MSSALAMVLTAAMAVPANGPEKVSGEVEQGLDLRGEWEGLLWKEQGDFIWVGYRDLVGVKGLSYREGELVYRRRFNVVDEGNGMLRATLGRMERLGIYQRQSDRLIICLRDAENGRPTSFKGGNGQHLLILHRVKPRK